MPRLNFETHGSPDNPAVLLLHGFMSSNAQWLTNIDALTARYFLVTAELWGHGDSPTPSDPDCYTLGAYYEQFESIRAELRINRWAVIGQSYGAGIMLNYAKAYPEVCTAAVATNSRSAFGSLIKENSSRRDRSGLPADLRKLPYHPIHARRFPDNVKGALVASADAMEPLAIRLGGRLGAYLNCRELVAAFPLPLLITNGRFEKSFQGDLESLRKAVPSLNVVDLEGGHSVNIEASDGFNATVLAFLDNVCSS
jgi:pimeloyl-ACP methyl ester carboxylesterase